jgi:hypothetical protein
MIYEILVRPAYNKMMTSDQLVWIESDLPTRSFERWLQQNALLDGSNRAPIVRWSIRQTELPAQFSLATQELALKAHIADLMSGAPHLMPIHDLEPQMVAQGTVKEYGLVH